MAMQGCLAYSNPANANGDWQSNATDENLALNAYEIADAMLAARTVKATAQCTT
jgi:hypothetical protein